ncbi:MAG: DNA polymerase IV [Actinomycetota bacterium]
MLSFSEPILHVDMDAFFVEVERRRRPELIGRPVAVGGAGRRGVVASASYEARRYGVGSAMPMGLARQHCPSLVVVPADHGEYGRVSEEVFAIFRSFTPIVEGLSLDEAFLDVSGLRRHYPHPQIVAERLKRRIREDLGLPASVGIASTKFVAKLASEVAKPNGIRHIPVEETVEFVQSLPVRSLFGVGEATFAALEGLGVASIADLASVPLATLQRRVGASHGLSLAGLANGQDPRPVVPDRAVKSISVSQTYEHDLATSAEVDTELLRLCDRLGSRMRRAGVNGRTVSLTVRYSDFSTITRQLTVAHTDTAHDLWKAALELKSKFDWDRPVRLLGVSCTSLIDVGQPQQSPPHQLGMMIGQDRWDDVTGAVESIRERFGQASVGPARLLDPPVARQQNARRRG